MDRENRRPIANSKKNQPLHTKDVSPLTQESKPYLAGKSPIQQVYRDFQVKGFKSVQEKLPDSGDQPKLIPRNVPIGYLSIDKDYAILEADPAASKMLGITHFLPKRFKLSDFITGESWDLFRSNTQKIRKSDSLQTCQLDMQRLDGVRFPTYLLVLPAFNPELTIQLQILVTDLTERQQAEEQVYQNATRLDLALQAGDLVPWEINLTNFEVIETPRLRKLYGISDNKPMNWDDWGSLVVPEDRASIRKKTQEALAGKDYQLEYRIQRPDGEIRWLATRGKVHKDIYGQSVRLIGFVVDITEHKQAEEDALRQTRLVEAINRILREYFTTASREDLAEFCLGILEKLTQSEYGFIGEIKPDGLLHDVVWSDLGWEVCAMPDKSGHRRPPNTFKVIGLHGNVLDTGQSLLTNEPRSHPASVGTPPGHPPIRSFLGVPMIYGGKTIGIIALANRKGGFREEDRNTVETLAPAIIEAMMRKQAESTLAKTLDDLEVKVKERTEQLQEAYDEIMDSQKALINANKQLKEYGYRITQIQEAERKRIAFELHDDTAQYLSILKMQLNALVQSGKIQNPEVLDKLRYLERDADRAFNDVRRYSHELRPSVLEHMGLRASLEQIVDDINKLSQFKIDIDVAGEEPELSEEIKLGFFRIAQEAINNIRKHAKAQKATVHLKFQKKLLSMKVVDDGVGFDPDAARNRSDQKGSLGLLSMQERADLIGASLKIESQPGKGTAVRVDIPFNIQV